ncbi:MAG: Gfo/Idh/MocA family oxidoreductase [Planctomycetes bacterium]|nr:Gfo/Idh/MocA family oxidoreductase [Planctomycetota bacterium]
MAENNNRERGSSRRAFLRSTSALVGGAIVGANARVARSSHPGGSDEIKVALIGCGGRGSGAITQALATKGPVTLWAVADAFEDNLKGCLDSVNQQVERGRRDGEPLFKDSKVDCPPERQFVGFDAYRQAIDSGADLIILATPPGFRPIHFEAAVEAGKNIFMEKPVAVDAPGIRRVMAANEQAKQKNLMVAVGLQRRHDPRYIETMKRIHDGAIGDILFSRVYWNGGGLWVRPRQPQQTEMEYQMRNWYYFNWICGDHIVEQHIHNLDVGNWMRGDMHPSEAQGMGGRQVRTGKEYGQIFDHHFVEFTYPDGTKMYSQCRHIEGCANEVREHAHGTKGTLDIDDGSGSLVTTAEGTWRSRAAKVDNHHQEHHDMFAALRRGEIYNEGDYGAESTFTAILGRMATYSGKIVRWDEALATGEDLSPASYDFAATPPVVPDANGFYPVPVPGKTEVMKA